MTRDEMIETLTSVQASCHACRWRDEVAALASVIAALRAPAVTGAAKLPPRPPMPEPDAVPGLPRYGVTWQGGKDEPLLTPMPDGYWTPWHLAAATPAAGAPPDDAREALSRLASWLGVGMGDDSTTVAAYESRIRDGVEMHERAVTAIWRDKHEVACNTIGQLQRERAVLTAQIRAAGAPPALVALDKTVRQFLGWLSADLPELHHVAVPRLAESWDRYRSTIIGSPAPAPVAPPAETRPMGACAAHDVLACEVCLTDEAFASPAAAQARDEMIEQLDSAGFFQPRPPAVVTPADDVVNNGSITHDGLNVTHAPAVTGGDAPPEIQVGDLVIREVTDTARRIDGLGWAYLRDGAVWVGSGDASICRIERNGVVIWRQRQEGQ